MSSRSHTLGQRGDTMIEVLMAIAVVSVVLSGAYVTANRSLNATQVSKERDMALRVAETQLERIRARKAALPGTIANGSCMDSALSVNTNSGSLAPLNTDNLNGVAGSYAAACIVDSTSAPYTAGINDVPFHIYNEVSSNIYTVHVRWPRSSGGQNQETILRYRIY